MGAPLLEKLKVRDFRCFAEREESFAPGLNLIVGPNARGKTSLLEAACLLLRLQSPRTSRLADVIRRGQRGLLVDGVYAQRHLQFYFSPKRKKLALDSVEQGTASEYLQVGRLVYFSNSDIEIVRGGAEHRRRFLDFVGMQISAAYRPALRSFERALRARNHLLKAPAPRWREIHAFEEQLALHGTLLAAQRKDLLQALLVPVSAAHHTISGAREEIALTYASATEADYAAQLAANRQEDARLRQTSAGPHRDDVAARIGELPSHLASEGQQRTLVLALKLGAAALLQQRTGALPLLLLDDIFGELDWSRRAALLLALPAGAQIIVTATHAGWLPEECPVHTISLA